MLNRRAFLNDYPKLAADYRLVESADIQDGAELFFLPIKRGHIVEDIGPLTLRRPATRERDGRLHVEFNINIEGSKASLCLLLEEFLAEETKPSPIGYQYVIYLAKK